MLKTIHKGLMEYISELGLPVYPADGVPDGAAFPYLTLTAEAPLNATTTGRVTLTLWCSGPDAPADRLLLTDSLLTLLPPRGLWLETDYETLLLTLDKPAQPLREKTALGMRTLWKLQRYPNL